MKGVGTFFVKLELDQSAKKTKKMGGESPGTRLGVARVHLTPAVVQFCSVHGSVHQLILNKFYQKNKYFGIPAVSNSYSRDE